MFYTLCALMWVLAQGLFHGMDFSGMVQQRPFAWSGFLFALLFLCGWAPLAGEFFAWL